MAQLILRHEGLPLKTYPIDQDCITVGRHPESDIQLHDPVVSGRHARLVRRASPYLEGHADVFVEDAGSTNGTWVNGERIERTLLGHGDVIRMGRHEFVYESEADSALDRTAIYLPDNGKTSSSR
jgi:pSer/pThr/pTyr-binding forkhead associated (FHA) protein